MMHRTTEVVKGILFNTGMADTTEGPGFGDRFAYARWLLHGRKGQAPEQTAVAKAVGRSQPTVAEWYGRTEPPKDYQIHKPLAEYLGVEKDWLIEGAGRPPEPALWAWWLGRRAEVLLRLTAERQRELDAEGAAISAREGSGNKPGRGKGTGTGGRGA